MTAVALIVEHETPDLLALCLASLKRFAPMVRPVILRGYEGADAHAVEIEAARRMQRLGDAEIVILLDTDVVILSDRWWPWLMNEMQSPAAYFDHIYAVGGLRHRGDVTQLYCQGFILLHAHCLAMTRDLFEKIPTFRAEGLWDTAWQVTMYAGSNSTAVVPLTSTLDGWPERVGLYVPKMGYGPYWAHLGRGTSFRPRGPWRERVRRMAAHFGSARARKILSYQQDRAEFLRKGWEIVRCQEERA